ncbi:MAG TPA: alpha/beta hydrolase [Acidimicrobiales bacterium]|nr:alpha/beta hydrolase [Acidimicrobiales bacterium]
MTYFLGNGFEFTGLAEGPPDGPLVLLLHGFPQTSHEWRHQLPALAGAGYRAVAFDQRGYSPGARPEGVEHYRMHHLLADVLAVADGSGAERFDLVGHDWGGAVAWAVAMEQPQRVRTLTAVSMPHPAAFAAALLGGDPEQEKKSSYIEVLRAEGVAEAMLLAGGGEGLRRVLAATGYPDPPAADPYVRVLSEPGALTAALSWYRAITPADAAGWAAGGHRGRVAVPTLYVWGDGDAALGRKAAESTASWVDGPYRFEVLEGIGHWIPEEVPETLNRLLLEHLATGS